MTKKSATATAQAEVTPAAPPIPFGGLVKLQQDGWAGVPDSPNPFYFGASDGLFIHRRMLTGRGVARVPFWPDNFPKFGNDKGSFTFEADPIPAKLMGQVVNFFERIYDRQHTEAAVLLVMHSETKEWRVFVPTQLVSHGGVNYVFEPNHIRYPWVIVGSIHSHCDFGAGHSGTDTNDADTFDGLHCTIGFIKRDTPQIVAMVAMNKQLFHYKENQFPLLFDYTEVKKHEAPEWWDRYVENTKDKTRPVGFELYAKYDRPTVVKSEKPEVKVVGFQPANGYKPSGYDSSAWIWNDQLKRMVHKDWVIGEDGTITYKNGNVQRPVQPPTTVYRGQHGLVTRPNDQTGNKWEDYFTTPHSLYNHLRGTLGSEKLADAEMKERGWTWVGGVEGRGNWQFDGKGIGLRRDTGLLKESEEFNARQEAERGIRWLVDGELDLSGAMAHQMTDEQLDQYMRLFDEAENQREPEDRFWEESIPPDLLEAITSSELMTDDDVDYAIGNYKIAGDPEHWKFLFLKKAISAVDVLKVAGLDVTLTINSHPPKDIDIVEVAERPNAKAENHPVLLAKNPDHPGDTKNTGVN